MNTEAIVRRWFALWESGDFRNLPLANNFHHTSPFGTIEGKEAYLQLVELNRDKFLGYQFEIHDAIYEENRACLRYTARQGETFSLDVCEWHYLKEELIEEVVAYYHIGEIREERVLE